jgi:nicotinamide N-methyltransferase
VSLNKHFASHIDLSHSRSALHEFDDRADGYDVLILSDLLHFDSSHPDILFTVVKTLSHKPKACVYVAAGLYTRAHVREAFLRAGEDVGLEWVPIANDGIWRGETRVRSDGALWSQDDLNARKSNVVAWIGRWRDS